MASFSNGRGIAHGGSGGTSTVFPDVCKTKVGKPIVPIPYVNVGRSADTSGGPTTVKIEGKMAMAKGAKYKRSTGDERGKKGGVVSKVNKDVCEFVGYSFDVKIEGRNACRLGDRLFHNKKNVAG
jgi:uncharacterized Zn-binding protein involved in type VI secretion